MVVGLYILTRGYCYWWKNDPISKLVLYKKSFGWVDIWELNPEGLYLLWLIAAAPSKLIILLSVSRIWVGGPCPFRIIPWHVLQLRKGIENLCHCTPVVSTTLCQFGCSVRSGLDWPAERTSS